MLYLLFLQPTGFTALCAPAPLLRGDGQIADFWMLCCYKGTHGELGQSTTPASTCACTFPCTCTCKHEVSCPAPGPGHLSPPPAQAPAAAGPGRRRLLLRPLPLPRQIRHRAQENRRWPTSLLTSAVKRSIGEVVQSRRRLLLGPSPGWKRLLALSHYRQDTIKTLCSTGSDPTVSSRGLLRD